jgi:hypothetical protein
MGRTPFERNHFVFCQGAISAQSEPLARLVSFIRPQDMSTLILTAMLLLLLLLLLLLFCSLQVVTSLQETVSPKLGVADICHSTSMQQACSTGMPLNQHARLLHSFFPFKKQIKKLAVADICHSTSIQQACSSWQQLAASGSLGSRHAQKLWFWSCGALDAAHQKVSSSAWPGSPFVLGCRPQAPHQSIHSEYASGRASIHCMPQPAHNPVIL